MKDRAIADTDGALADVLAVLNKIEIPLTPFFKGGSLCHALSALGYTYGL
jgi:hypothetical protein